MISRCGRIILLVALPVLLGACDKTPEPTTSDERKTPVVVYVAFEDDADVRERLDEYTAQTGVIVIVRRGNAGNIVNDVIENTISPPADVLITQSVVEVWRAAEEGALRPIASEKIAEQIPAWARDADGLWAATGMSSAAIVSVSAGDLDDATTFAALAESRFAGKLCISTSAETINKVVIASLIDDVGVRPAELLVRGWIKNLAAPPFASEDDLFDAINAGACKLGIATSSDARRAGLFAHVASPAAIDIDGIGIARHAANPEGALALVEWILSALPPATFESVDAAAPKNVGVVAWLRRDAELLAERAHYP